MAGFLSPPLARAAILGSRGLGVASGVAALLLFAPAVARAEPRALKDNHFSLDLFQGPILAPISVTGIAGAYAAYAEGIPGMVVNAAAPAVREPFSVSYFEMDGSGSISIPLNFFGNDDFDNSGSPGSDYTNFVYGTLGGILQYGPLGAGFNAELQRYSLTASGQTTSVFIGKYHLLGAVRLLGDQLMLGAGARFVTLGIAAQKDLTMFGANLEVGCLIRPDWQSFRFGATFRLPVDGGRLIGSSEVGPDGVRRAGGLILPEHVVQPWELEMGLAVQVGPRPLNPAWSDPHAEEQTVREGFAARRKERRLRIEEELARLPDRAAREARRVELMREEDARRAQDEVDEQKALAALKPARRARYWNWPREHLLVTAELLVTGKVADGVSIQRFLGQNQGTEVGAKIVGGSGASVNFSPRFGVEGEPIPDRVHTRFGSYYEPSRFGAPVGRQHFTFGADVKAFKTTWFGLVPEVIYKVQASLDLAPRYQSFSLGFGVWH